MSVYLAGNELSYMGDFMKKRVIAASLFICACLAFSGCGKNEPAEAETEHVVSEEKDNESNEEETKEIEKEKKEEHKEEKLKTNAFLIEENSAIYVFKDGIKIPIYEMSEEEADSYFFACEELYGDYVYIIKTNYDSSYKLYIYSTDGKQMVDFSLEREISNFKFLEYDGNVYLEYWCYGTDYSAKVYKYVPGTRSIEYDSKLSQLNTKGHETELNFPSYGDFCLDVLANTKKEIYGWSYAENCFIWLDPDTLEEIGRTFPDIPEKDINCFKIVGNYGIVSAATSQTYGLNRKYYRVDMKTGEAKLMVEGNINNIKTQDGFWFYYVTLPEDYLLSHMTFYKFDVASMENEELYKAEMEPGNGMGYIIPGYTDFGVNGNQILYKDDDENGVFYNIYDMKKQKYIAEKIDYVEKPYVKYAKITANDNREYVNLGKEEVNSFNSYIEEITLNSSVKNAEIINEKLQALNEEHLKYAKESGDTAAGIIIEEGQVYEYYSPSSVDIRISGIREIGTDYLQITFDIYEYWGGAHGFNSFDYRLYRISTGEEVTLKDICGVDFETYRRILVAKTIDDWKNSGEYTYFYDYGHDPETETEFYNQLVNDIADFDTFGVDFCEEGIYVQYPPYMYGPYSSGYIEIFISYEELCMNINS